MIANIVLNAVTVLALIWIILLLIYIAGRMFGAGFVRSVKNIINKIKDEE